MCLAIPGQILEIDDDSRTRMATVEFGGVRKQVCLAYLPDAAVGEYVIVHVGFAIANVDEAAARHTLATFRQLGLLDEGLGGEPDRSSTPTTFTATARRP